MPDKDPVLHLLWLLSPEYTHLRQAEEQAQTPAMVDSISCSRRLLRNVRRAVWRFRNPPPPPPVAPPGATRARQTDSTVSEEGVWRMSLSPSGSVLAVVEHDRIRFRFSSDWFGGDQCQWPMPAGLPRPRHVDWDPSSTVLAFSPCWHRHDVLSSAQLRQQPSSSSTTSPVENLAPLLFLLQPSAHRRHVPCAPVSLAKLGIHSLVSFAFVSGGGGGGSEQRDHCSFVVLTRGARVHRLLFNWRTGAASVASTLHCRPRHTSSVSAVCALAKSSLIAVGGSCLHPDGTVYGNLSVWNVDTGGYVGAASVRSSHDVGRLSFAPDGRALLGLTADGVLQTWQLSDSGALTPLAEPADAQSFMDAQWWDARSIILASAAQEVGIYDPYRAWQLRSYQLENFAKPSTRLRISNVVRERCFILECQENWVKDSRTAAAAAQSLPSLSDMIGIHDPASLLGEMFTGGTGEDWDPLGRGGSESTVRTPGSVSVLTYRIVALCQTTPQELFERRLDQRRYAEALHLAQALHLDAEAVHKHRWTDQFQLIMSAPDQLPAFLDDVQHDVHWVVDQCSHRAVMPPTSLQAARVLLRYGQQRARQQQLDDFAVAELAVLEQRLELYAQVLAATHTEFEGAALFFFYSCQLAEVAAAYAANGEYAAVRVLIDRQPDELLPHLFEILDAVQLSASAADFEQLLPVVPPSPSVSVPLPAEQRAQAVAWFERRARDIESNTGLTQYALELLDVAIANGLVELQPLRDAFERLAVLVYDCQAQDMTLAQFEALSADELLHWYLRDVVATLDDDDDDDDDDSDTDTDDAVPSVVAIAWQRRGLAAQFSGEQVADYVCRQVNSAPARSLRLCRELLRARILTSAGCMACVRAMRSKPVWSDARVWRLIDDMADDVPAEQAAPLRSYSTAARLFLRYGVAAELSRWFPVSATSDDEHDDGDGVAVLRQFCRGAARQLKQAGAQAGQEAWLGIAHDAQLVRQHLLGSAGPPLLHCTLLTFEALLAAGKYAYASYLLGDDVQFDRVALAVAQEILDAAATLDDDSVDQAQRCLIALGRRKPGLPEVARERNLHSALAVLRDSFGLVDVAPVRLRDAAKNQRFERLCRLAPPHFLTRHPTADLLAVCELLGDDANYARLHVAHALLDEAHPVDTPNGAVDAAGELFDQLAAEQFPLAAPLGVRLLGVHQSVDRRRAVLSFCLAHLEPASAAFATALEHWRQFIFTDDDRQPTLFTDNHDDDNNDDDNNNAVDDDNSDGQSFDAAAYQSWRQHAASMSPAQLRRAVHCLTSAAQPMYIEAAQLLAHSAANRLSAQLACSLPAAMAQLRAYLAQ